MHLSGGQLHNWADNCIKSDKYCIIGGQVHSCSAVKCIMDKCIKMLIYVSVDKCIRTSAQFGQVHNKKGSKKTDKCRNRSTYLHSIFKIGKRAVLFLADKCIKWLGFIRDLLVGLAAYCVLVWGAHHSPSRWRGMSPLCQKQHALIHQSISTNPRVQRQAYPFNFGP